jgi:hypothetical protein
MDAGGLLSGGRLCDVGALLSPAFAPEVGGLLALDGETLGGGLDWPDGRPGGGRLALGRTDGGAGGALLPMGGGAMPMAVRESSFFAACRSARAAGSWSGLISDVCVVAMPFTSRESFGCALASRGSGAVFGGSCSVSLTGGSIPGWHEPRPNGVTDEVKMIEVVVRPVAAEPAHVQVPRVGLDTQGHR